VLKRKLNVTAERHQYARQLAGATGDPGEHTGSGQYGHERGQAEPDHLWSKPSPHLLGGAICQRRWEDDDESDNDAPEEMP